MVHAARSRAPPDGVCAQSAAQLRSQSMRKPRVFPPVDREIWLGEYYNRLVWDKSPMERPIRHLWSWFIQKVCNWIFCTCCSRLHPARGSSDVDTVSHKSYYHGFSFFFLEEVAIMTFDQYCTVSHNCIWSMWNFGTWITQLLHFDKIQAK